MKIPKSPLPANLPKKLNLRGRRREMEEEVKKGSKNGESNAKKREKKVFDFPGQKRDPPEEREPLRIFYETLHKQVPASEMAAIWIMECGLLPKEEAKKVFDRKQKKTPGMNPKQQSRKPKSKEDSDDEDSDEYFLSTKMPKKQRA